ncbi:hypothetical protein [Methylobacterium sp. V23]|uniref:hypothetical protein n=1 Tax=Methylobacterium sp. V23 TaxID=2044878 RepID=UPI000CDAD5C3|nr:hypothetical protein [Methylobacterium sp. V23]POR42575.1 hypothetical protein CRT23_12360 [Methylobacterium sp. V23]
MPSYPIRPTFPIDVSSSPSVTATRVGTGFRFDLNPAGAAATLSPGRNQFFAALEDLIPGATATLAAAVPSDPGDLNNRAFTGTAFVTAGCTLVVFAKATLGLTEEQIAAVLAAAASIAN